MLIAHLIFYTVNFDAQIIILFAIILLIAFELRIILHAFFFSIQFFIFIFIKVIAISIITFEMFQLLCVKEPELLSNITSKMG